MERTIEEYLTSLSGKKIAVVGIGVSNTPLLSMLLNAGIVTTACDRQSYEQLGDLAKELEEKGAQLQLGEHYLDNLVGQDVIFRTPGMHPNIPQLVAAKEAGAIITSEMEVFFDLCPCTTIGVTGSDGKTTTTTLITQLLEQGGHKVHVGGNIGAPLLPNIREIAPTDMAVVELSSFQLMTMTHSPNIAVVTNVAPNHLDVHTSMEEYVAAKCEIFAHQTKDGTLILNWDNDITRSFGTNAQGKVCYFSRQGGIEQGILVKDNIIGVQNGDTWQPLLPVSDILIPGEHNIENYMAALGAVAHLIPKDCIASFAKTFGGVAHRIELVRVLHGVTYYNDSIASSPTRTMAGLRSFDQKVHLIAGGYDKNIPFDELGHGIVKHVKELYLSGHTATKIAQAVEYAVEQGGTPPPIHQFDTMEEATMAAHQRAEVGDVVLLSPACASFDQFKNFAQRGLRFCEIVNQL